MTTKKIQIINLKKPQKLADDFVPKNMKIVTDAIETVFDVALEILKKISCSSTTSSSNNNSNDTNSINTNNLSASSTAAFCRATCPNDVNIAAEKLVVNRSGPQMWQELRNISRSKAINFVDVLMEKSTSTASQNQDSASASGNNNNNNNINDNVLIMKNLSRLWLCWSNAVHFLEHLLNWLERGNNNGGSNINNMNNNNDGTSNNTNNNSSSSATIRSVCFSVLSEKLLFSSSKGISATTSTTMNTTIIQKAIEGFMYCLHLLRQGDVLPMNTQLSEMAQLKSVLLQCGCYGDEDVALYILNNNNNNNSEDDDDDKEIHQYLFLPRYIKETLKFYRREANEKFSGVSSDDASPSAVAGGAVAAAKTSNITNNNSSSICEEFVRVAHTRLNEERQRAHLFLATFSRSFADAAIQKTLISLPFESVVDSGFSQTIAKIGTSNNDSSSSSSASSSLTPEQILKRLYLLSGLPNVLYTRRQKLLEAFKLYVTAESTMIISTAQGPQQEVQMIPSLLQLYTKCEVVVCGRCFSGDEVFRLRFRESMEKALRHRQAKVAEHVARQFDVLLREGDRSSAANILLSSAGGGNNINNTVDAGMEGGMMTTRSSSNMMIMNNNNNNNSNQLLNSAGATTSSSSAETTLAALEKLARFARLVPARDIFETFYMRDLARRLLQFRNINEDLEHTSVSRLKVFCGPQIAIRCNGMMKDIELSRNFINRIGESLRDFDPSGKLEPLVLTQGYWPSSSSTSASSSSSSGGLVDLAIPLPQEFSLLTENFCKLYCVQFKKRKLSWSPVLSSAVVKARFGKGGASTKELTVSFMQAHILLALNENKSVTEQELRQAICDHHEVLKKEDTARRLKQQQDDPASAVGSASSELASISKATLENSAAETVERALVSLVAAKILLKESNNEANSDKPSSAQAPTSGTPSSSYTVNANFTHRQVKIRIVQVQKKQQEESAEETVRSTIALRSHTVDAAIARIMKARKKVGHWDLVTQTIESTKLPLDPADVKKRIETLIDKDFMKRDPEDPSVYLFVA